MMFKGVGSMTDRQLLVVVYPNNVTKDGKTRFADVQLNADDPLAPGNTDLHVSSVRKSLSPEAAAKYGKSETWVNTQAYSEKQFDAIKEAAGDNFAVVAKADGTPGPTVYSVKGSLMPSRTSGLVINTNKPLTAGPAIDENVLNKQFESVKAAKEAKAAEKAAEPVAAQAEAVAEAEVEETVEPY